MTGADDSYDHYYEALELMWEEEYYPETEMELKNMMSGYGFLNASTKKGVARQVNTAWKHLKEISPSYDSSYQRRLPDFQEPEHAKLERHPKGYKQKRAKKTFIWKGKKYRKGQYLPKELRE